VLLRTADNVGIGQTHSAVLIGSRKLQNKKMYYLLLS